MNLLGGGDIGLRSPAVSAELKFVNDCTVVESTVWILRVDGDGESGMAGDGGVGDNLEAEEEEEEEEEMVVSRERRRFGLMGCCVWNLRWAAEEEEVDMNE